MRPKTNRFSLLAIAMLSAARILAGNLIANGDLEAEQLEHPPYWQIKGDLTFHKGNGPEGLNFTTLGGKGGRATLRQQGMTLVPGEMYRISGYIKTENLKGHAGLIVHNSGWLNEGGLNELPENSDWTKQTATFKLFPSRGGNYGVAAFNVGSGKISFAGLQLEAISEAGKKGSMSMLGTESSRLIPMAPLLSQIPLANPILKFRWFGSLDEKKARTKDATCVFSTPNGFTKTLPLARDMELNLRSLPAGEHQLSASVFSDDTGKPSFSSHFAITLKAIENYQEKGRKLNNLVVELISRTIAGPVQETFTLGSPSWIFVRAPLGAVLTLGTEDKLISGGGRPGAVRFLPAGKHTLAVSGAFPQGTLTVRRIPEIFNYPACVNSYVKENGAYDWAFSKKYMLPALTMFNGGKLDGDNLVEARKLGLQYTANFGVWRDNKDHDPKVLCENLKKFPGFTSDRYDGTTLDELFFARPQTLAQCTEALRLLLPQKEKLIYPWIVGTPMITGRSADFLATALNSSGGRGKVLFEAYCHPQKDEESANRYLDNFLCSTMRSYRGMYPLVAERIGFIMGNFNQIPLISLEHNPHVDFKYFLDMQAYRLATHKDFADLRCLGYWGTYYADEEMVRWSFELLHHYAIEGKREMLSKKYGFTYNLDYLKNGDFADGLDHWTVSGSATPGKHKGYGKDSQARWTSNVGDTFCILEKKPGATTTVSQTAVGLIPGKTYVLQTVVVDYDALKKKVFKTERYALDIDLPGAKISKNKSFVHLASDKLHMHIKKKEKRTLVNLHRLVFQATDEQQELVFSNASAKDGTKLAINFIQLKPYFEDKL